MNETCHLAAHNVAATALAYQEHGFTVKISLCDGLPSIQIPETASELTHSLAQLNGTIAEALAMQMTDVRNHRPQRSFSEYLTAASYAAMQAPSPRHGLGRPAIIGKIKAKIWAQYALIQALAEQVQDSIYERQETAQ
ncbi:hypothetical protein [Glutamicibacter sp.]|uniref:hypothetical protein n=1 Tax=Glutamicibacter sp. TaxID=1931995 RepID=UPI002FE34C01